MALPLSFVLGDVIEAHLGRSLAADAAAGGVDYDWWQEFMAQATGIGTTFVPSILGFGAVLDNVSGLLDNKPLAATIAGVTTAWLIIWSFLSGGVLDRYARGRPTRATGFFAACGTHFWRFARLGLVGAAGVLRAVCRAPLAAVRHDLSAGDAEPVRRTHRLLRETGLYVVFLGILLSPATWYWTTPASVSSWKTAGARSGRWPPGRGS